MHSPTSAAGNSDHSVPGKSVALWFGNHVLLWLLTAQSADKAGGNSPPHITGSSNADISPAAAAAVATTRPIRTNRRIEKEKRLKARSWFGVRGLNPACWLFDRRWGGLGRTAYSVERE